MKRQKIDNEIEKLMLTGIIISDSFIRDLSEIYDPDLIEIPYVDIVAEWCFEYHDEFRKAPGIHIQDIFFDKASHGIEPEYKDQIENFLSNLSEKYDENESPFNEDYVLEKIKTRFKAQALKHHAEDLKEDLRDGRLDSAEVRVSEFILPSGIDQDHVCPFTDEKAIQKAFEDSPKPLFEFPGKLGEFMNPQFVRDSLVSICGSEKRGKSWVLMSIAIRAARYGNNVAFFQVGDMSQSQMIRRMGIQLAGRSDRERYCGNVPVPVLDCELHQQDDCERNERTDGGFPIEWKGGIVETVNQNPNHEPCIACIGKKDFQPTTWYQIRRINPLSYKKAIQISKRFHKRLIRGRQFKLATHPNDSINIADIQNILDRWEMKEGFIPDVIVIDYADILAPEPGQREYRQQVNKTWKAMRGELSQKRNCCVVTGTQADAASYDQRSVGMKNFSEDKRKRSHVTAEFGLNQTVWEKRRGIMRIGAVVFREEAFDSEKEVTVLSCLQIGQPFLTSF